MNTKTVWCFMVLTTLLLSCSSTKSTTTDAPTEAPEQPQEQSQAKEQLQTPAVDPGCARNLSLAAEYAKVENYDAAYVPWQKLREDCPDFHYALYAYGEKILGHKIKTSENEEKTTFINDLMTLYDDGSRYFPDNYTPARVAVNKAILMYDEKLGSDEELFNMLDEAFKKDRANFKNSKALYLYFSTLVDLHNAGKKELQQVFDTYDDVTEHIGEEKKILLTVIDELLPKEEAGTLSTKEKRSLAAKRSNAESFDTVSASIDAKLGALADCDKLVPLYRNMFPAKKDNAVWLKRAANRMDSKECSDDPLFIEIVEALHQLDPSAKSAYYLGILNDREGNSSEAIKYYEESLKLETDVYEKARTALKIAGKYRKTRKATSRKYALQALGYQPSLGRAYLLIANLYANSANECGSTSFEKRAIYWLAADTAVKAGQVDSSLKKEAAKFVSSYRGLAPSKTDIFQESMAGKMVAFNCWVKRSIKVPDL